MSSMRVRAALEGKIVVTVRRMRSIVVTGLPVTLLLLRNARGADRRYG